MKIRMSSAALIAAMILTAAIGQETKTEFTTNVDRLAKTWRDKHKVPGVGIAIGRANQIILATGIGSSDLENAVPVTDETVFRTASIAKPITAVAVLQLVDQGKLSLDDPIQKHCPEYPQKDDKLTIRNLLCHQGGVRHYKHRGESSGTRHYASIADSLQLFKDDPLLFRPGTRYSYTTYGFSLLGRAVETASGKSFREYIQENIFDTAGMDTAGLDDTFRIIPNRSRGYVLVTISGYFDLTLDERKSVKVGQLLNCQLHDTSMKVPGGGLICTPSDLVQFGQAMLADQLITKESKESAWKIQPTVDRKEHAYGLGWGIGNKDGIRTIGHSGGQAGTSTMLTILPDHELVVAVMCNLQNAPAGKLASEIAKSIIE